MRTHKHRAELDKVVLQGVVVEPLRELHTQCLRRMLENHQN